jgi:transposase
MLACVDAFLSAATRFSSKDVVEHIRQTFNITISRQLAHVMIRRAGYTFKRTRKRGTSNKPKLPLKPFANTFFAAFNNNRLVALDESGFDHRCNPRYGYALRGKPAIVTYKAVSDRRRLSLLMSIHQNGTHERVVSDAPVNGAAFASFLSKLPYPSGTVLLLDNASIHKTKAVKQAATERGYELLYLPPYSPEFNPIELVFGVAKQHFYKARYADYVKWSLDAAVQDSVTFSTKKHTIQNCFHHAHGVVMDRVREEGC